MKAPTVSCIVPVFNGERFLRDALESILAQTRPPEEILVIDDGSTDDSATIAASFGSDLRCIHRRNGGPAAARNTGVSAATGDLLSFLDADDLWNPDKLQRQVDCLMKEPDLGFCVSHLQNFWMPELAKEEQAFAGSTFAQALPAFTFDTMVARRSVFEEVGPLDEGVRVSEDVEWFLRVRDRGVPHLVLPEVLVLRRLHSGNLTRHDLASRDALIANLKASLDRRRD